MTLSKDPFENLIIYYEIYFFYRYDNYQIDNCSIFKYMRRFIPRYFTFYIINTVFFYNDPLI